MPARKSLAAALCPWLIACLNACLIGCEEPGTVHVVRHPSGKIKEMWTEKGRPGSPSVREGTFKSFHPDGSREGEIEYRGGRKNGPACFWHEDGRAAFQGEYRDDFLVREARWDAGGNPTVDRRYAVRPGRVKALGPSGDSLEVLETCAYLEDAGGSVRHGLCRMDYPGGKLLSTRYYQHGRLQGQVKAWHPDGTPWMEGSYDRGAPTGAWKTLTRDGKPAWSASFARGEPSGTWQEWFADGKPKSRSSYKAGRLEGPYQEWYPNGMLRLRGDRRDGRREGAETAWYPDGGRLYEAAYLGGRLEGDFRQWHPGGVLRMQCRFQAGRKHGPSRVWHRQGGLMELARYDEGRLHGTYRSFAPDGRVLVTREFRGGALAFDSKAKELIELLGARDVKVPVGAFGLYWGMTPAECRGALSVLQADGVRQDAETMAARAVVFADSLPRTARLRLRFNAQGELWQIHAEIAQQGDGDFFPLCERLEAEMGAELGKAVMRKAEGREGWLMTRKRDWGRFSVTQGAEIPVRQDLPVVTAEGHNPGPAQPFRFTLSNHLFREYVNPANASVTPPDWPEETFLAASGRGP